MHDTRLVCTPPPTRQLRVLTQSALVLDAALGARSPILGTSARTSSTTRRRGDNGGSGAATFSTGAEVVERLVLSL
jgi:hypothetical protein